MRETRGVLLSTHGKSGDNTELRALREVYLRCIVGAGQLWKLDGGSGAGEQLLRYLLEDDIRNIVAAVRQRGGN